MLKQIAFLLVSCQAHGYRNNYIEPDLEAIRQEFDKKLATTYYDILILKSHIVANAKFIQEAIGDEIDRLQTRDCRRQLSKSVEEACRMGTIFENLAQTRAKFSKLREVACATVEICQDLNPLSTQAFTLEKCSLFKIADLRRQSQLVSGEFESLKRQLFEDHELCVRDLMNEEFGKIASIVYECSNNSNNLL